MKFINAYIICSSRLKKNIQVLKKNFGKKLFGKLDTFYLLSSKLCNCFGYKNEGLTLNIRNWNCPECGNVHDRDTNAAINILNKVTQINDGCTVGTTVIEACVTINHEIHLNKNLRPL